MDDLPPILFLHCGVIQVPAQRLTPHKRKPRRCQGIERGLLTSAISATGCYQR